MARGTTLRKLAEEAGVDLDEALVCAWDAGHEFLEDGNDRVPANAVMSVRRSLGLINPKEIQRLSYWEQEWGLDREGVIVRLAADYGIHVNKGARVLPKGAFRRLRVAGQVRDLATDGADGDSPDDIGGAVEEVYEWSPPGHCRDVVGLIEGEVCQIHDALANDFASSGDPIEPPGVRDQNLLASAVSRPETALGNVRKYTTVEVHAAALLHSLALNHAFHNGNKRTALVSLLVVLDRNNVLLTCTDDQLFKLVLRVAQHRLVPKGKGQQSDREVVAIADWICQHGRPIQRGERPLRWRDLRKKLEQLGCVVGPPLPGNKVKIQRTVNEKLWGIPRTRKLKVTSGYRNDGAEADVNTLNHIRRELRLDEKCGVDSEHFYGKDRQLPDEFIAQYRPLLRRLGRL